MARAFVTYSHKDSKFVDQLVTDLESAGLSLVFDKQLMLPGHSLLRIFEEIGTVEFLLAILSPHSVKSDWVKKELAGAVIREIEEPDFKVIPIIKERCQLPTGLNQALRDKYQARFDSRQYNQVTKEIVLALRPPNDARTLYSEFQGPVSDNPFRRVRAEHFENIGILARSYTEPEAARYERIVETKPVILEGGRGSGKTMTLKSMLLQALVSRLGLRTFDETTVPYFGVYLRFVPGSFATQSRAVEEIVGMDRCVALFLTEIILKLTHALVGELRSCADEGIVQVPGSRERLLVSQIVDAVRPSVPIGSQMVGLDDLLGLLSRELRFVSDYVNRLIFGENREYEGVFLNVDDLKRICNATTTTCFGKPEKTVLFLLDEFENLLAFQKVVANSILKASAFGHYSVKIAAKKAAFTPSHTLEGQEIEEPHDYASVDVDYNISDTQERQNYKELLTTICQRSLSQEAFGETMIGNLLEPALEGDGLEKEELDQEIAIVLGDRPLTAEDRHRLGNAAVYRLLHRKRGRRKQFAGFDDLVTLSSGIIRVFLELVGLSYHFAVQDGVDVKGGQPIGRSHQTSAAYALSDYYLTTIRNNVATVGPQIQQLVIDLGDIFRAKLLKHNSEPEGSRLAVHDPHMLVESASKDAEMVLTQAVIHSIFQNPTPRGGMRPKHITDIQPQEYILNRVYSPSLAISPRPRWRTRISTKDLLELMDPALRQTTKTKLARLVSGSGSSSMQSELPLKADS